MHGHPSGYLYVLATPITLDMRWDPISLNCIRKERKNSCCFVVDVDLKASNLEIYLNTIENTGNVNSLCDNTHQ
jgi:hypothetical protein